MYDSPIYRWLTRHAEGQSLVGGLWGFEREGQRVDGHGDLALSPRPPTEPAPELGQIIVDFAESQAELISAPRHSAQTALAALEGLHDKLDAALGEEYLWPFSMPPRLPAAANIPIARFDDSPEGKKQTYYRESLSRRYGKKMQMISGLHVNYSFPGALIEELRQEWGQGQSQREFSDSLHFAVARNALRHRWLLILLFGVSPVADASYSGALAWELARVRQCCPEADLAVRQYQRFAVSLRVSRYGYSNRHPQRVSYDSIGKYTAQLRSLVDQGIFLKDSELYAPIRVKQVPLAGESQTEALERRGAAYLELRILDNDPFTRSGISLETALFIQVFLVYCLTEPWSPLSAGESETADKNHHLVALAGRKPGLKLFDFARGKRPLDAMANELFPVFRLIAAMLDGAADGPYAQAVATQERKIIDRRLLPSNQILAALFQGRLSFIELGLQLAKAHKSANQEAVYVHSA